MGNGVGAGLVRDFHQALGDQRARNAGAEQIIAFVAGIGAHHREDVIAHEFLAQVLDEDVLVGNAHRPGLFARGFDLLALAEIGGEGDHLQPALHLEPFGDDGSIEAAGIGEDDALDIGHWGHLAVTGSPLAGLRARWQSGRAWWGERRDWPWSRPRGRGAFPGTSARSRKLDCRRAFGSSQ